MSPQKNASAIDLAVKQIGGRAVKVVEKAAAGGPWTIDAIERAAAWLMEGSKEGGLQRRWPNLAARLRTILANAKKVEAPKKTKNDDAAPATLMPAPARARAPKPKKTPVVSTPNDGAPTTPAETTMGLTIADLSERFLKHLESTGKSRGTVFSYSLDLNVAARHFGKDRDATTLSKDEVAAYNASDAVQKNRAGAPKNAITIAKLQRTLRLALVWAAEAKLIAEAPVPTKTESDDAGEATPAHPPAKRARRSTTPAGASHSEPLAATGA